MWRTRDRCTCIINVRNRVQNALVSFLDAAYLQKTIRFNLIGSTYETKTNSSLFRKLSDCFTFSWSNSENDNKRESTLNDSSCLHKDPPHIFQDINSEPNKVRGRIAVVLTFAHHFKFSGRLFSSLLSIYDREFTKHRSEQLFSVYVICVLMLMTPLELWGDVRQLVLARYCGSWASSPIQSASEKSPASGIAGN